MAEINDNLDEASAKAFKKYICQKRSTGVKKTQKTAGWARDANRGGNGRKIKLRADVSNIGRSM